MSKLLSVRADAVRNRERLIAAARELFSTGDKSVSVDAVVTLAGVGIGTLYRHFPTREALVEAVYYSEIEALASEADELLVCRPALDALRLWMDRYARFVFTKYAMHDALRTAWASRRGSAPETRARVQANIAKFLSAGELDGTIRADIIADDVGVSMSAMVLTATASGNKDQLSRMLDLLADALRPRL